MSEAVIIAPTKVRKRVKKSFKTSMFIDKIGIEFEGGWDKRCIKPGDPAKSSRENREAGLHNYGCNCLAEKNVHDGSVSCSGSWNGEVPIGPNDPKEIDDMFQYYPEYGNRSCGLHVHVSFKRQYYYRRLMDPAFYEHFKTELKAWGERHGVKNSNFYSRLRGDCHYCKDEWLMEQQVATTDKAGCRYAILNFCYNLHKTLEVRVLPYFKSPETAKQAVLAVLNIICDWLYQHRGKRPSDARAVCELDAEFVENDSLVELEVIVPPAAAVVERTRARARPEVMAGVA
jgi:hypothetical protein